MSPKERNILIAFVAGASVVGVGMLIFTYYIGRRSKTCAPPRSPFDNQVNLEKN